MKIVCEQLLPFFSRTLSPGRIVWLVVVLPPREVLSVLDPDSMQYSTLSEHSFLTSTLTDVIGASFGASCGALLRPKLDPFELGSLKFDPLEPDPLEPDSLAAGSFEGSSEGDELGGGVLDGCASCCRKGPQPQRKIDAANVAQRAAFIKRIVSSLTDTVKASKQIRGSRAPGAQRRVDLMSQSR